MSLRKFFFRYRGITPLPFILILLYQSNLTTTGLIVGLLIVALGEAVRLAGVRQAGGNTRTRKVGAKRLSTGGIYAHVRNPLYLGNLLIYVGFAIIAGGPWMVYLAVIALIYFSIQYGFIIALEEDTLTELFGEEYRQYTENVPRLLSRLRPWRDANQRPPKKWSSVFNSEKSTLLNQAVFLAVLIIKELTLNHPYEL
ncbi:MAG TPA: isoprenylcysteine carboxylmethyltransferase family protein [Candidatus Marinimicrobia bacterium]|nr:isoprenylcysteine carboxylmethyltransferase family protein [Candidatus Neomarinimicrobiota bacterium]